jgi:uncharacterized protein (DUF1778 family)
MGVCGLRTLTCTPNRRTVDAMTAIKDERMAVRLTTEQDALIRHAAESEGTNVTEFVVQAAYARARDVLADRRLFQLDDAAWNEFLAVLDRPVQYKQRLSKLFAEGSVFE